MIEQLHTKILLVGYYGRRNTGDDAMLYGMLTLMESCCPCVSVYIPTDTDIVIPTGVADRVHFIRRTAKEVFARTRQVDAVFIGGGTILHDHSHKFRYTWTIIRYLLLVVWAKFWAKDVYMVGVGMGPFTTFLGKWLTRIICQNVDYFTIRDSQSSETLRALNVPETRFSAAFDLACLLEPNQIDVVDKTPTLGVSILPYFYGYGTEEDGDRCLASRIGEAVRYWLDMNEGSCVKLLPFLGIDEKDGDLHMADILYREINRPGRVNLVPYSNDPRELLGHVSRCTGVITMRYHAAVYAFAVNRPMLIIDYHPKCRTFAHDIGFPANGILSVEEVMDGLLLNKIDEFWQFPNHYLGELHVEDAKRMAQLALPPMYKCSVGV